jgi:PAS domain S-box-containing protein
MKEGERFRRAFEDAAIGIALLAVEPFGKYLEVNPTFCRMTGYSRDELLTRDFQSITAAQDIDKNLEQLQPLLQGSTPSLQLEKRYVRKDGGSFWVRLNISLIRDDQAQPVIFIVQIEDIDERKRAEEALRNEEKRLLLLVEQIPAVLWTTDTELRFTLSVGAGLASLGLVPNQVVGMTLFEYFRTDDPDTLPIQASRRALRGESVTYETTWNDRVFQSYVEPLRDGEGRIIGVLGFAQDITDRKRVEEALRDSGQLNEQIIRSPREGIVVHDRDLRYRAWNPYMEELTGLRAEVVLGKHPLEVIPLQQEHGRHILTEEHIKEILDGLTRAMAGEKVTRPDFAVTLKHTGQTSWNSVRYDPLRNAQGEIVGIIVTVRDVTERKRAEEALRQNENRLQEAVQVSQTGIFDHGHLTNTIYWSPEQRKIYGFGPDEPVTLPLFLNCVHPEDRERIGEAVRKAHDPAGDGRFDVDHRIIRRDGAVRWLTTRSQTYFKDEGGTRRPVRTIGAVLDITELRRTEEALRESSQFNQQVIDNAREGIIVYDRDLRYVVWNPFMEELSGLRAEKLLGKRPRDLLTIYKEEQGKLQMEKETVENIEASVKRAMTGETFSYLDIPFLIKTTGMMGWTSVRYGPFRNAQGEIVGVIATVRDVTEQKRLEEQLRHAQKLEAVGQLAGGVAHEFNNMLTAIIGNLDLAIGEIPPESDQRSTLTAALQAARRAALLTQQLLTLSHRGPMDLQPQHLGAIAQDVVDFLRQTIDRRIQVRVQTPEALWTVLADAAQMHQVMVNLCVNARDSLVESLEGRAPDAAPPGWEPRIVVAAENVRIDEAYCKLHFDARPGEHVRLSVSDNGYGIAEDISYRIFEPFFTTKEVGRGTGLGLATVYGIIKQHDAWIEMSSTKYGETTFKLYLPRTDRPAVPISPGAAPSPGTARGTETILFVDDEAPIRRLGQTILEHHGYTVLLAKDGEEALEVFSREQERIKLIVLDLTMPRLSGREVLKQLLRLNSRIRVLISSGHHSPTDSTELQNLGMVQLVPKPYRPDDLARSVRKLLDAPVPPRPVR